jgi:hypothetical protein
MKYIEGNHFMNLNKITLSVFAALAISACSSSPDTEMAKRLLDLEEAQKEIVANQKAEAQELREKEMGAMPDWFLEPPKPDETGFYGVGYMKSKHMGHAVKGARLNAEADLAKQYKQELSGSERSFEQGNNSGDVAIQTTFLIDKIMDSVPVVGYTVVEQVMVPIDGTYETFALLKLPYDEFNRVLQSVKAESFDKKVRGEFDDLERRLKDRRKESSLAEQEKFNREQEALKNRADILNSQTENAVATPLKDGSEFKTEQPSKLSSPLDFLLRGE